MIPAFAELLAQLQERQRLDVASRNGLWERFWREQARWTASAGEGAEQDPSPLSLATRLVPVLEGAKAQKSVGAVLAIVRQALQILHEDESSGILGKP